MRRPRVTLRRRELLGAVALLGVTLVPTGTPAEAAIAPTEWFHCTRSDDSYRVPNHVTRVHVMAGGGVGGWGVSNAGDPGSAAAVGGELIVVPTESLYIKVGCAGETARGGWGDPHGGYTSQSGGSGGLSYCCNTSYGGGGGGASVVSTLTSGCGAYLGNVTECVVAGGGGGSAGGTSGCTNLWGGAGGYGGAQGQNGAKGNTSSAGNGGRGASQTSLHAAGGSGGPGGGNGDAGDPYVFSDPWVGMGGDAGNGGSGSCWGGGGGGGGAGYRGGGGGGGGAGGHGGGGGGGGSSWIGPLMGGTIIPASNAYHGYVTVTPLGPASAAVRGTTWPQGAQALAVGQTSSVWISVYDQYGNTMPNTDVTVNVEGVHTRSATIRTDSWGSANYTWVGTTSGVDIARFTVSGIVLAAVGTAWQPGATPKSVTLGPPAQNRNVGTYATVTATVRDTFGNPVGGVPVRFTRSFANPGQVSVTSNWAGEATHTYRCNSQGVDDIEATVVNSTVAPARAEVVCVPTTVPTTIPDILTTSTTAGP